MKRAPSPALVISIVALFVALGGTSYAAVKLNGKNIKTGTVTSKQVKDRSLTGTDIKDESVRRADLASDAFAAGPKGDKGDPGAQGTSSLNTDIPSGMTVIGAWSIAAGNPTAITRTSHFAVTLPGRAAENLVSANVNFKDIGSIGTGDADSTCNGSNASPKAPPGKVCIYRDGATLLGGTPTNLAGVGAGSLRDAFLIQITLPAGVAYDTYGKWAYTAP